MHIEPGVVGGTKIFLGYGTAAVVMGATALAAIRSMRAEGIGSLLARAIAATFLVFCFFEVLPHYRVGVSEVHLILGTTLFLLFGPAAAALGLAGGLLAQGFFFAPTDLPQYGMNVTTLLMPLFGIAALARRIIQPQTAYVDLSYAQTFKLSFAYQGGTVVWVAFWAFYGQGFDAQNLARVAAFGSAYMTVILIEPLIDLAVLAAAKSIRSLWQSRLLQRRLYAA